jgi:hypothetical protein
VIDAAAFFALQRANELILRRQCGTDQITGDRIAARILSAANRRQALGVG